MWSAEQKKGLAIALVGHGVYAASQLLLGGASPSAAGYVGGAVATLLMVYGSALYVRGKGYASVWGLGGFLPFVGLGTLNRYRVHVALGQLVSRCAIDESTIVDAV